MIHAKRTLQPICERLLVRLPRTRHGCYTACATLPSGITPVELSSSISIQSSTSAVPVVPLDTPAGDDTGCPNCMVVFSDLDRLFRSPPMNPRRLSRRREDCDRRMSYRQSASRIPQELTATDETAIVHDIPMPSSARPSMRIESAIFSAFTTSIAE